MSAAGEGRELVRHTKVYAVASLLNRAGAFLLVPIYTRWLGPADYGVLGVVSITAEIVGAVLGVKLGQAMARIWFDHDDERERAAVVSTALLGMLAIIGVAALAMPFVAAPLAQLALDRPGHGGLMAMGVLALLCNSLFTLGLHYHRVREQSRRVLLASTWRTVGNVAVSALFVAGLDGGTRGAVLAMLLVNAAAAAAVVVPLLRELGVRVSGKKLAALLAFGLPLLPAQLAEIGVAFADRTMLVHLVSLGAAGVYFLAVRFGTFLGTGLVQPFAQIYVVRRFAALRQANDDAIASRTFTGFFAVVVVAALGLALLATDVVALVADPEYLPAARVIPFAAVSQVLLALLLILELGIWYAKLPRLVTLATLAMLAVHLPLNLLLIPRFGVLGAAAANATSTAVRIGLTVWLGRRLQGPRPEWSRLGTIALVAVVCFGLGSTLEAAPGWGSTPARVAIVLGFATFLLFGPVFAADERRALLAALRGRSRAVPRDAAAVEA